MKELVKMIFCRILHEKTYLFLPIVVTPVVLLLAVNFTRNMPADIKIAVVGENEDRIPESEEISVFYVQEKPPFSKILDGTYDAVVTADHGIYTIETVKDEHVKKAVNNFLQGKPFDLEKVSSQRGEISNFTGFIMMFLLLIGVMLYRFYYEERGDIEKRILSAPVSVLQYRASHWVAVWCMVFFPGFLIIGFYKLLIGFDSTVGIAGISSILFLMSFLGSSFGLFLASVVRSEENAVLAGAMSVILTTLLSGCFHEITANHFTVFVQKLLPQKYILDYAMELENKQMINSFGIMYVLFLSGMFILAAVRLKCGREIQPHKRK